MFIPSCFFMGSSSPFVTSIVWYFDLILDCVLVVFQYLHVSCFFLNVDGYYNALLALFDNGVEEGFIKPGARQIVVSAPTAKELMTKMEVQYSLSNTFLLFVLVADIFLM